MSVSTPRKSARPSDPAPRPGIDKRLSQLIQCETVSAEVDERGDEPFDTLWNLLKDLYPRIHEQLEREQVSPFGMLYHWKGAHRELDPVVLMAHIDVVPANESDGWSHPPFAGVIANGVVYGRGTLDDKGPLVVLLEAVENLLSTEFVPERDVYLSFGGNEETFGEAAIDAAAWFQDRDITPWLVLDEGGAVVAAPLPLVPGQAAMIGTGEKGAMTVELSATSDPGHASAPPRLTATSRIARAVTRLTPSTFSARTPAAVTRMLAEFSRRGPIRLVYRLLARFPWLTARVFALLGGEPAALVRTTVAPTMLAGGSAANVLPATASATVNLRIALGETVESTLRRIRRRVADRRVESRLLEGDDPSPASPTEGAPWELLASALAHSHPEAHAVPYVMMAASDSRHFHRFSPAVYRFAPLAMSGELRSTIHGVDERVPITELVRGERFYRALITGVPGADATTGVDT